MYSVCLDSCGNDCRKSCLPTFNHMYISLLCPLCVYIYKSVIQNSWEFLTWSLLSWGEKGLWVQIEGWRRNHCSACQCIPRLMVGAIT